MRRSGAAAAVRRAVAEGTWGNYIDNGIVIAGSPDTVAERLTEAVKGLRIGHLMASLQIGSMPHDLTLHNISLFATKVMPKVRDLWDADGWQDRWWPSGARTVRATADVAPAAETA